MEHLTNAWNQSMKHSLPASDNISGPQTKKRHKKNFRRFPVARHSIIKLKQSRFISKLIRFSNNQTPDLELFKCYSSIHQVRLEWIQLPKTNSCQVLKNLPSFFKTTSKNIKDMLNGSLSMCWKTADKYNPNGLPIESQKSSRNIPENINKYVPNEFQRILKRIQNEMQWEEQPYECNDLHRRRLTAEC